MPGHTDSSTTETTSPCFLNCTWVQISWAANLAHIYIYIYIYIYTCSSKSLNPERIFKKRTWESICIYLSIYRSVYLPLSIPLRKDLRSTLWPSEPLQDLCARKNYPTLELRRAAPPFWVWLQQRAVEPSSSLPAADASGTWRDSLSN